MSVVSKPPPEPQRSSLWTTPVASTPRGIGAAVVDKSVSVGALREAVEAARRRALSFSTRVSEELLRKSF